MSGAARMYLGRVPENGEAADGAPDPRERLVVVGNGMAGCRAVEEILKRDPARYDITIFGAEPRVNYNRIMLSPVPAGEKTFDDIVINDEAWYAGNGIVLHAGRTVTAIDTTVVHRMDVLMERQLDESAGYLLTEALKARGVQTVLGAHSEEILGQDGQVSGLRLKDGRVLPADILVMAVGIRPSTGLAKL